MLNLSSFAVRVVGVFIFVGLCGLPSANAGNPFKFSKCKTECKAPENHAILHNFGVTMLSINRISGKFCECGVGTSAEILKGAGPNLADNINIGTSNVKIINTTTACPVASQLRICLKNGVCCRASENLYTLLMYPYCRTPKQCDVYAIMPYSSEAEAPYLDCSEHGRVYGTNQTEIQNFTSGVEVPYERVTSVVCANDETRRLRYCTNAPREPTGATCRPPPAQFFNIYVNNASVGELVQLPPYVCQCDSTRTRYTVPPPSFPSNLGITFNRYSCPPKKNLWVCDKTGTVCCEWIRVYESSELTALANCDNNNDCHIKIEFDDAIRCPFGVIDDEEDSNLKFDKIGCSEEEARTAAQKCRL